MNKHLWLLLVLLVSVAGVLTGTDYYVDVNRGNDLNSGLSLLAPWQTLKPANQKALAGDTIFIREGTYSQADSNNSLIHPQNSGSSGAYITYKNYANEAVVLTGCYQPILLAYPSTNYIKIDGLRIDGGSQETSAIDIFAMIHGNRNVIQNCTMQYLRINSDWMKGIYIIETSSYNRIINNTIRYVGKNEQPTGNNIGDGIWVDGGHNLIEFNDISYCGHNCLLLRGRYNIARWNVLHGHIGRSAELHSPGPDNSHLVFDSNLICDSGGFTPGPCPSYGLQADSAFQVIRRNEFYNNHGHGIEIWGMTSSGCPKHSRIYNNISFKNGLNADVTSYSSYALEINQISESSPGDFRDVAMKNNILYKNRNVGIYYKPQQTDPNDHVEINNHEDTNGSPGFIGENVFNFRLSSESPCIDAGSFLTNTKQAGSGTIIPVVDSSYFIDGFEIVEGDIIQLQGQTQTAKIISVDYSGHTLSINRSLEWTSGQGVSLAYSGSAPDIGAYEYESSAPPQLSAVIEANPTSGQAPLNVNFTGSATGGTAPYSYSWNFGDDQASTSQNPFHSYPSEGAYTATLTVTDNEGGNAVASQVLTVTKTGASLAAAMSATPTSGQAPLNVNFTGSATGGTAPYSYSWNFGDGQTSTSQNPSHTYASVGDYTATLTVTDNNGANAVASQVITVTKAVPLLAVSIKASRTSGPAPLKIKFSAKLNRGIRPKTYSWSFGDGKASSASKPTHKYTLPGTYTARLTLSDSKGARGSASVIITAR